MRKFFESHQVVVISLLLAVGILALYWQVLGHEFINYDDDKYVSANPCIRNGLTAGSISWAFTTLRASNWHPLTWISHLADVSLYDLEPAGHHLTNVVLHILNTLLLFLVLLRLTNPKSETRNPNSQIRHPVTPSPTHPLSPSSAWKSAFVAALFAIHPLHVESVAWVAERKDVLSTFFFFLTILAYIRYVKLPSATRYLPVVLVFALGLLAKPMLVTLPFVLLLLDYWPLGRLKPSAVRPDLSSPRPSPVAALRTGEGVGGSFLTSETRHPKPVTRKANTEHRTPNTGGSKSNSKSKSTSILLEKVPLLALAGISSVMTFFAQRHGGSVADLGGFPLGERIANALVSYVMYGAKMIWPSGLAVFYPHPGGTIPSWQVLGAGVLLFAVTVLAIRAIHARPYLTVGWFWYLGTLIPVIGLVQVGFQARADRYTYVPLIGLSVMVAWGVPELLNGRKGERGKGRAVGGKGKQTFNMQRGEWRKGRKGERESDPRSGIRNPKSGRPLTLSPPLLLGIAACAILIVLSAATWRQVGYWRNGITLFEHAIAVTRDNYIAENSLGEALAAKLRFDEAIPHYRAAVRTDPDPGLAHNNLGAALAETGRFDDAMQSFSDAVRSDPKCAAAYANLGKGLVIQGKYDEALDVLSKAIQLNPEAHMAHNEMAGVLLRQGKLDDAERYCREAIRLKPDFGLGHYTLATVLVNKKEYAEAWDEIHLAQSYGIQPGPRVLAALTQGMPEPAE